MARVRDYKAEYRQRKMRHIVREWEQKMWSQFVAGMFSPQIDQFMREHGELPN